MPRLSEELYLPLVRHTGDASYLAGDWTMGGPFGEHWLFDHAFGPIASSMPLVWVGWIGRLVTWTLLAFGLIRLGRRYDLGAWGAAAGVTLWLVANQALIGSDWMFGTFESKTVAYVVVVAALLAATAARIPLAVALFGAGVSLHIGVGGWAAFAGGAALLADPRTRPATLRWSWLGLLLAAPGVVAVASTLRAPSTALVRFLVIEAVPYHVDPFFGGARLPGLQVALRAGVLVGMLVMNLRWYRRSDRAPARRFLVGFQVMALIPVAVAFVGRAIEAWQFLMLTPLRLAPLVIPLCFYLQLVARVRDLAATERSGTSWWRRRSVLLAATGCALALVVTSPLLAAPRMVSRTAHAWFGRDDLADAFAWIRGHTPTTTRCVVPVDRQDAFMRAERPIVGTWQAIRYDDVAEWKQRVGALVGGPEYFADRAEDLPRLRAGYDRLTAEQLGTIADRYRATCIVTSRAYPLPLLHRTGSARIYRWSPTTAP